ncbi:MAG TPA: beta-propeller fold lactonase family protein [Terriglobales bacterium]|nr:beta-propeller fold lactonase family protein [Terriglobales bacterium]
MTGALLTRRFLFATAFAVLALMAFGSLPAHAQKNLIYINANNPNEGQNGVIALVNDGAGNLTPLLGSPFFTGGTGVSVTTSDADFDSDGEVAINAAGNLLFAVNGHTNTIAAFILNADGSLTHVTGSPFPSNGTQPASIAYKDNALGSGVSEMIVVNKDSDPLQTQSAPSYTSFTVSSGGVLTFNTGSTFTLPAGASPAMALIRRGAPTGFFGIEFMAGTVSSYKLTRAGIMSVTNSLTMPGPTPVGVGAVLHPTVKGMYLTLPADHQVEVYGYDTTGKMAAVGSAQNQGLAICWDAVNATGTRLYTSETASGTISVYDLTNTKKPVQLQHIAVSGTGALPTHMKVDPTGKFLYVLDRVGVVHIFDILADGTVNEGHTAYNLGLSSGDVPLGMQVLMK